MRTRSTWSMTRIRKKGPESSLWLLEIPAAIIYNLQISACNHSKEIQESIPWKLLPCFLLSWHSIKSLLSINFGIGSDLCVLQLEFIIFTSDKWIQDLVCNVFGFCLSCPDDRIPVSQKLFVPIFQRQARGKAENNSICSLNILQFFDLPDIFSCSPQS